MTRPWQLEAAGRTRSALAVAGLCLLASACAPVHYRNALQPSWGQAEFDRDWYDCRRENVHLRVRYGPPTVWIGTAEPPPAGRADMVVDEEMARACLAARGWRPVED